MDCGGSGQSWGTGLNYATVSKSGEFGALPALTARRKSVGSSAVLGLRRGPRIGELLMGLRALYVPMELTGEAKVGLMLELG